MSAVPGMRTAPSHAPGFLGRPPDQLGFVTADLPSTVAALARAWGGGPWEVYEYTAATLRHRSFRGRPGVFESRNAVAPGGRLGSFSRSADRACTQTLSGRVVLASRT